jgi:glucose-6-phosphate isomerase
MGGSSLAPEVFRLSFGSSSIRLHVLDTTDADAIAAAPTQDVIYLVSSKSGTTIETLSAFHHFWELTRADGSRFAAVTDPGTPLEALARERGFRQVFSADPEIGGRYSALSYFGLVPAALIGADLDGLLAGAQGAATECRGEGDNPGLWLGATLGALAQMGRDKLTFVVDEPIASLGLWAEQLVAESLGKHGKGILPIADEPLGDRYGEDRVFLHVRSATSAAGDESLAQLAELGHPVITLPFQDAGDLGRIMFLLEFATAVAGWALAINPFDQPNVQAAKDKTNEVLEHGAPEIAEATDADLRELLDAGPPAYLAIQAYMAPSPHVEAAAAELRSQVVAQRNGLATTFGYGPRYLHSTGQLHKGGPPTGRFLQLVAEGHGDIAVPGRQLTFEQLKRAQADGDLLTLRDAGLPAQRIIVRGDIAAIMTRLQGLL